MYSGYTCSIRRWRGAGRRGAMYSGYTCSIRRWRENLGHDLRAVGLNGVAEEAILCAGEREVHETLQCSYCLCDALSL